MGFLAKISTDGRGSAPIGGSCINEEIKVDNVRLIGSDGEMLGVVPIGEALKAANEVGLDLVMVSEEATPPVCKILDYSKHKYELLKKKTESRKKQKTIDVKEIQLRPFIGSNDLVIKCKSIKKFIENGDKVKVVLRYRGREISRQQPGQEIIKKVQDFCQDFAKEESPPKLEGSTIIMILTGK